MAALTVTLIVLSLVGIAVALRRWLELPIEAVMLTAVALVVLALYFCALVGGLRWGPPIVLTAGLLLGALTGIWRRASWRTELGSLCSPGMVAFYCALAYCWIRLTGEYYFYWDELATWGLASKAMYLSRELPSAVGSVELVDYPPGGALFHYFVSYFIGFSEGHTYFAHALLVCCAVLVASQPIPWRRSLLLVPIGVIGYLMTFIFAAGPASIYADLVIASWWGASIGTLCANRSSPQSLVACGPPLAALPVFKEIGWWLALLAVVAAAASYLVSGLWSRHVGSDAGTGRRQAQARRLVLGTATVVFVLLAGPLITRISWRHYVETHYTTRTLELSVSLSQIVRSFSPQTATERERITIERFQNALWNDEVSGIIRFPLVEALLQRWKLGYAGEVKVRGPHSTILWFVALVTLGIAASCLQPERGQRMGVAAVVAALAVGFVGYLFGHLLSYLYAFGEWEGTRLGSFGRYVGLYLFGWSLAILIAVVHAAVSRGGRGRLAAALLVVATMGALWVAPYEGALFLIDGPRPLLDNRARLIRPIDRVKRAFAPGDRVYVIFQGTNGLEHKIVRYEIAPAITNQWCWSVGSPYVEGEPWTCPMKVDELAQALAGSKYVFLGKTDAQFWEKYGSLFPEAPTTKTLFKVMASPEGQVRLDPLE